MNKKNMYEARKNYASAKNTENKEILKELSISDELADLYGHICSIRHDLHSWSSASAMFNTESSDFDSNWEKYKELCDFVGISSSYEEEAPTDADWYLTMSDEDKAKFNDDEVELPEDADELCAVVSGFFDNFCFNSEKEINNKIEELNTLVEQKLKEIDEEYGTSYCPSGSTRIF
jgi:hypothetical protein